MMNDQNDLPKCIEKILKVFDKNNLYFTFVSFDKNGDELTEYRSTFGRDNVSEITYWSLLMSAKLLSGKVTGIALVLRRRLLGEKNETELYHFFFMNNKVSLLDEKETFEMQNTDSVTQKPIEPEKGIICMSSKKLFEEIFDGKYNIDSILDKISRIGVDNLRNDEKKYLKSVKSESK